MRLSEDIINDYIENDYDYKKLHDKYAVELGKFEISDSGDKKALVQNKLTGLYNMNKNNDLPVKSIVEEIKSTTKEVKPTISWGSKSIIEEIKPTEDGVNENEGNTSGNNLSEPTTTE